MLDAHNALRSYLKRVECSPASLGIPNPSTLKQVHRQHALHIPFENLSLVHHKLTNESAVRTDLGSVYEKLVVKRRGGWCFEMNTLLHAMLTGMGFNCYPSLARVVNQGSLTPPAAPFQGLVSSRNKGTTLSLGASLHLVLFTHVEDEVYLCDVGFGGQGLLEPVLLKAHDAVDSPGDYVQAGTRFRLRRGVLCSAEHLPAHEAETHPEANSHVGWYLQAMLGGVWTDLYYFTETATTAEDIEMASWYTVKQHPLFTNSHVVSKPTEDGRVTLHDFTLKTRRHGETEINELKSEQERDALLEECFNIDTTAV